MTSPLELSAVEQSAAIRNGTLSAEKLMQATLARIEEVNPKLNAIVSLADPETLLAEACAADQSAPKGALHGLPIAIKDLEDATGFPTSQGSPVFAGQMAETDSPHVALLRAAGAIVIGKTNTPEFGLGSNTYNTVHGITVNPYDPSRSCGGSSGGAAVALATGMLSIADGSDMMGSLRNPAGWCNVYGMRPSWGRVPRDASGDMFLHQLSTHGPMARTPQDLALLLDVMTGSGGHRPFGHPLEPIGTPKPEAAGKRIAWLGDWSGAWAFEAGILELCQSALDVLSQAGAHIESLAAPFDRDRLWQSWTTLRSWALSASLTDLYDNPATREQLKPEAIWEIERGRDLSAMDIHRASEIRSDWHRTASALLEEYDAIALPAAQVWPFDKDITWPREIAGQMMDTYHRWMEVVVPASLLGLPAVAVPAGFGTNGLPMGLQLIGAHGQDAKLLDIATAYHEATLWPQRHSPQL